MNQRAVAAIVRKDLTMVLRNRGVRTPLIVAPLVILVVLPVLLVSGATFLVDNSVIPRDAAPIRQFGEASQAEITGFSGPGLWAVFVLEFFLAPLYLLVPLIVATVIAADSFAGERERRTLEALLHTPTTDDELLVAKLLASWIPAVAVGVGGFAIYSVVANVVAWPFVGRVFFPPPVWVALALWVTPAVAALGLGVMVVISSRVNSLQAAHQLGSLVVLPVLLLVVGQIVGLSFLRLDLILVSGAVLWIANAALLLVGSRTFRRDRLAMRL